MYGALDKDDSLLLLNEGTGEDLTAGLVQDHDTPFRSWIKLVIPGSLSSFCRSSLGMVATAFLGHLQASSEFPQADSTDFLAASALTFSWFAATNIIIFYGTANAISVLCSQAFGANDERGVDTWLRVGAATTLAACIPIGTCYYFSRSVIQALLPESGGCNELCGNIIEVYSRRLIPALPPRALYACVSAYFSAQNIVLPLLCIDFFTMFANIFLNYLLIYGIGNVGGYGFRGSALATVGSPCIALLLVSIYFFRTRPFRFARVFTGERCARWVFGRSGEAGALDEGTGPKKSSALCQYLSQAVPLSIGGTVEEWQIQIILFMAGALGEAPLSAFSGIISVFLLLTSVNYGIMSATTVKVGNYVGAKDKDRAIETIKYAFYLSFIFGTGCCAGFILFRNEIGKIFSSAPTIWHLTSEECWLIGPSYILLCAFFVSMAALEGQARATELSISFLVGAWFVSIPMAYIFAFTLGYGLIGLWIGIIIGYLVITLFTIYFYLNSEWDKIIDASQARLAQQ
jgi:multidrug resistance protein, MATE family|eukprot:g6666.t1